jgi:hypothetical protein
MHTSQKLAHTSAGKDIWTYDEWDFVADLITLSL